MDASRVVEMLYGVVACDVPHFIVVIRDALRDIGLDIIRRPNVHVYYARQKNCPTA